MREFIKNALLTGLPFGVFMGAIFVLHFSLRPFFGFRYDLLVFGVGIGTVCGVLFGVLMAAFSSYQGKKLTSENPCGLGEELIKQGGANHFLRGEGVGGYLYLTNERLLFKSHKFNIQNHEVSILIADIDSARPYLVAGFVPSGLEVVTGDRRERFVVAGRHDWAEEIRRANGQRTLGTVE